MEAAEQVIEADVCEPLLDPLEEPKSEIDQLYDAVMRRWAEPNLATVAGLLDRGLAGLPARAFRQRAATFAVPTMTADLLTWSGGTGCCMSSTRPRPAGAWSRGCSITAVAS